MKQADFQVALIALRDEYQSNLPAKIQQLEELWRGLCEDAWDVEAFHLFTRLAHSLAGSGATYGFVQVSQAARALEVCAKQFNLNARPNERERAALEILLAQLQDSMLVPPQAMEDEFSTRDEFLAALDSNEG